MKTYSLRLKQRLGAAILTAAALLPCARAQLVSLDPVSQNIAVGGTAFVNLNISGLGAGAAPSLGGWLANIAFNNSIITIGNADVTFGTNLDLGVFGAIRGVDTTTAGLLKIDEVSFEDASALNAAQPAAFTLATLKFIGVTPGTSTLTFSRLELSNELGFPLTAQSATASITVGGGTGVPDDGAITLAGALCLALCCAVHARRRRQLA